MDRPLGIWVVNMQEQASLHIPIRPPLNPPTPSEYIPATGHGVL